MEIKTTNLEHHSALLLIRTPFQAWIVEQVLAAEAVHSYHVVYFTQNNSEEDQNYYGRLSENAVSKQFFYVPKCRYDIQSHFKFYHLAKEWRVDKGCDLILMASIDSLVLNSIASKQAESSLITFDDGLSNIFEEGIYHSPRKSWRISLYRKFFGSTDLLTVRARIKRHYTMYSGFRNIVPPDRLRSLQGWSRVNSSTLERSLSYNTYFIGQPFHEVLSASQLITITRYLEKKNIDWYVPHPREHNLLNIGVPSLDKHGRIAEEAIINHSGITPIHVIGWFSATLLNLKSVAQCSTMLLLGTDPRTPRMLEIGENSGCEVVIL